MHHRLFMEIPLRQVPCLFRPSAVCPSAYKRPLLCLLPSAPLEISKLTDRLCFPMFFLPDSLLCV